VDLVTLGGYAAMVVSGILMLWAALWAVRGRAVVLKQLIMGGVVEALLIVQVIAGVVGLVNGREIVEPAVFWGYLVVALLLLPAGAVVAIAERSRWSSVVLLVIALALLVMEYRILTLWWMEGGVS